MTAGAQPPTRIESSGLGRFMASSCSDSVDLHRPIDLHRAVATIDGSFLVRSHVQSIDEAGQGLASLWML